MAEVRLEIRGSIALVTLDRPPVNAMTIEFCNEIADVLEGVSKRAGIAAVVLTGVGRCLSAGVDLKAAIDYDRADQDRMLQAINRIVYAGYGCPIPVIGAINGHAIAGGLILALTCDYRIGPASKGQFGVTESRVGIPYPIGAIEVAKAELGSAARRLILFGQNYGPEDALAVGIFDELQALETLEARAMEVATDAASMPATGFGKIKRQLRRQILEQIEAALSGQDPLAGQWILDESRSAAMVGTQRRAPGRCRALWSLADDDFHRGPALDRHHRPAHPRWPDDRGGLLRLSLHPRRRGSSSSSRRPSQKVTWLS